VLTNEKKEQDLQKKGKGRKEKKNLMQAVKV